jgi:hypothetical protein
MDSTLCHTGCPPYFFNFLQSIEMAETQTSVNLWSLCETPYEISAVALSLMVVMNQSPLIVNLLIKSIFIVYKSTITNMAVVQPLQLRMLIFHPK